MRLEAVDTLADARGGWDELAEAGGNVFSSWDWADAWWRCFGAGRELMVRRARAQDGRLVGILPLYRTRRGPVAVARFLGHGPAGELGPPCAPADRPAVGRALRATARELGPAGLVLADRLAGEAGWTGHLGGRSARRESSPVLRTEGRTWDAWLAQRSRNFRQQVRRRERRLVEEHGLVFRRTERADQLGDDMTALMSLHAGRWGAEGSVAFAPPLDAFHRDFAQRALAAGRLRLWLAEVDGRPVAAWYGLRFARREMYYQAGRDPAWDELAVGFVLLVHSIRSAMEDGVVEYRFGVGDDPYKTRFADADPGLETIALGRRRVVALATAAAEGARGLPPGLRRAARRRMA